MASADLLKTWRLGNHSVPGIWRYMLPRDLQDLEIPSERRSTCSHCPKVVSAQYHPTYKCCTYHPRVPNFLLGLGLEIQESRPRILHHIEQGFVVPEGANSTPQQWLDAVIIGANSEYGQTEDVRCQFLDERDGRCGIYAVRNGVCSSFFCLNDHGPTGEEFWDRLQELVAQIEGALAQWCLTELGFDVAHLMTIYNRYAPQVAALSDPRTKAWRKDLLEELFGDWYGRESDLMWRCGSLVDDHKEDLFTIAKGVTILEPASFEQALVAMVPEQAAAGVDPSYRIEGDEPAQIDDLWYVAKLAHRHLWQIPTGEGLIRLNPEAVVTPKDPEDQMSLFYDQMPMMVTLIEYLNEKPITWRQYLTAQEAAALQWFATPRRASDWLDDPMFDEWERPQQFVSEWLRKNVLQWVVKH